MHLWKLVKFWISFGVVVIVVSSLVWVIESRETRAGHGLVKEKGWVAPNAPNSYEAPDKTDGKAFESSENTFKPSGESAEIQVEEGAIDPEQTTKPEMENSEWDVSAPVTQGVEAELGIATTNKPARDVKNTENTGAESSFVAKPNEVAETVSSPTAPKNGVDSSNGLDQSAESPLPVDRSERCFMFGKPFKDSSMNHGYSLLDEEMLVLPWIEHQPLYAPFKARIVKLFQSPYQGLTLYLFAEDGAHCVQFSGLVRPLNDLREGSMVKCGQMISPGPLDSEQRLTVQVLQVAEDGKWWRGKPLHPSKWLEGAQGTRDSH